MSSKRSSGKTAYAHYQFSPKYRYLLDKNLSNRVADGLQRVGWNITTVEALFNVDAKASIKDETIIARCAALGLVWVTGDSGAQAEHRQLLIASGINVVWVEKPRDGFSAAYTLALLSHGLIIVERLISEYDPRPIHGRIPANLRATPSVLEYFDRRYP